MANNNNNDGKHKPAWQQQVGGEIRSVTPAMNNTRGGQPNVGAPSYPSRVPSPGPRRNPTGPSSTGLIRLTLRKPMGIVFEPMYDPNAPSIQRGVRICDLPRTGAAALSRRLEIGDELLSINDKTMSRLTFDEIMDFIIEADPEQVNLLFRRPRKEILAARSAAGKAATNSNSSASVKWIDDEENNKKNKTSTKSPKRKSGKYSKKLSKKNSGGESAGGCTDEDDATFETLEENTTEQRKRGSDGRQKRGDGQKDAPYESESFLDLLIDTICSDYVCKGSGTQQRPQEDEYDSETEDDRTLTSYDDSTYVTYESSDKKKDESFYEETDTEDDRNRSRAKKEEKAKVYETEDDATLDTYETVDGNVEKKKSSNSAPLGPLGLASTPERKAASPAVARQKTPEPKAKSPAKPSPAKRTPTQPPPKTDLSSVDEINKAPITDLEFDEQIDHGADVSVMESLGGPSLLIEKQRQAQLQKTLEETNIVPADIVNEFGADYPADYGLTREQTIHKNPLKFYTYVVKHLLEEHEPEKVRLLDKLLAKYKGREDHLVQKLSVRYNRNENNNNVDHHQKNTSHNDSSKDRGVSKGYTDFTAAVNKTKESPITERNVKKAQERAAATFGVWPEKETKEAEPVDNKQQQKLQQPNPSDDDVEDEEEDDDDESDFTGDSIDGTSPAVIAQMSELLNYVYGKTSVPGQIDRVSTIMRAYEGREAVLLELLETKALIKANSEKENAANLPEFLRNSLALVQSSKGEDAVSPLSSPLNNNPNNTSNMGNSMINDDVSSMSGVSSPVPESNKKVSEPVTVVPQQQQQQTSSALRSSHNKSSSNTLEATSNNRRSSNPRSQRKKGLFGGLFKKNRSNIRIRGGKRDEGEI
eukprot:CAMPEP_0194139190 /NCGR_PEP_ID=MMETSP0152-20130528/8909_1 /TAXON_ID=1049557 /ORGANISM="Thalassiothrix antarctica, Strain L6-D1" /LENGTH=872 /DNA_ID=CAMNT_0038836967 /DNA_START=272 /DNA_END=2890 /DNA_ORIENTATION=-